MSIINFSNTRQMEGLLDEISPVKDLIETKINLSRVADREKRVSLTLNKVMRICFIVGLSVTESVRKMTSRTSSFPPLQPVSCQVFSQCTICPHYIRLY